MLSIQHIKLEMYLSACPEPSGLEPSGKIWGVMSPFQQRDALGKVFGSGGGFRRPHLGTLSPSISPESLLEKPSQD